MGTKVFILAHREDATQNLFKQVKRYHDNIPPSIKPVTGTSSSKELYFKNLDTGYAVGTAGSGQVGRSDTIQYFHGSEAAFWENTDEISSGIMQTIPDRPGTEVILESTANGMGNFFHEKVQKAMCGEGRYQLIFIPWYLSPEYAVELPDGFAMDDEEMEYRENYDLTPEQILWRRYKIKELAGGMMQFKQEYPAYIAEAFQTSGEESFISPEVVIAARKSTHKDNIPHLVVGVDPARFGDDRTAFVYRRGREIKEIQTFDKLDTMEVTGRIARMIDMEDPTMTFIDSVGLGAGIIDRLREMGYGRKINAVNAGERAFDSDKYTNKRAEMWGEMKEWLEETPVSIPDRDDLHADLCGPAFSFDSRGRTKLEKKEDMKKRGVKSPDIADALALTFAAPVAAPNIHHSPFKAQRAKGTYLFD